MVISSYPSNCEIEPVAIYLFMNTWYLKAKHHPFIIDGLIFFQQVLYRFVNCFGGSSFDDMAYPDFRQFNTFTREYPVGCFPNSFNEVGMGDGYFIVLAEYRDYAIFFQMFNGHFFCIGFNERKSFYFSS